jgi:hypothetical protein
MALLYKNQFFVIGRVSHLLGPGHQLYITEAHKIQKTPKKKKNNSKSKDFTSRKAEIEYECRSLLSLRTWRLASKIAPVKHRLQLRVRLLSCTSERPHAA